MSSKAFNISTQATEKLRKWATKFDITEEVIMPQYLANLTAKDGNEAKALIATKIALEKEYGSLLSNAPFFYGYVLEDNGTVDIFELMRGKAIRMSNSEDPSVRAQAEELGLVDINGTPLDYRKTVFGKANGFYGQPLTGHSYQRNILAIVSEDENFTNPFIAELTAQDEYAKNLEKVSPFAFYKFRANFNPKYPTKVRLSAGSKFSAITPAITIAEVANKIPTVSFEDLDAEYGANFAGKKRTSYLTAIRGYVAAPNLTVIKGSRAFTLMDDETDGAIRCRLPESVPVVFQETDAVIVFAKLYAAKNGKIGAQVRAYAVVG
jgi:hypothetical protein